MAEADPKVVLIAEDEASIRKLITTALHSQNYVVLETPDGERALGVSQEHRGRIDLLITDIRMPGLSGKQLAEKLCEGRPSLKVLYISGYTEYDVKDLARCDNMAVYFLQKPFTIAALVEKVKMIFAVN